MIVKLCIIVFVGSLVYSCGYIDGNEDYYDLMRYYDA